MGSNGTVKETAHLHTDKKKYDKNFNKIDWGKKPKEEVKEDKKEDD